MQVLLGGRGQSLPGDLLLFLGDNVHGHEDVESIVDPPADVLLVERAGGVFLLALGNNLSDQLVGDLVVGGGALFLDLLADHHGKVAESLCGVGPGRLDAAPVAAWGGTGRRLAGLFGGLGGHRLEGRGLLEDRRGKVGRSEKGIRGRRRGGHHLHGESGIPRCGWSHGWSCCFGSKGLGWALVVVVVLAFVAGTGRAAPTA
mmetsp:Transcript_17631/g.40468  ORF Transcript_17631/g.40468 Transcript_17631/m.40468 type:complete len:202 (-) Transcript_17631:445-1050(-)